MVEVEKQTPDPTPPAESPRDAATIAKYTVAGAAVLGVLIAGGMYIAKKRTE